MNLERGFRRLAVILSLAVLGLGIAFDFMIGSWPQCTGIGGILAGLVWLGFYIVRWVVKGFTSGGA